MKKKWILYLTAIFQLMVACQPKPHDVHEVDRLPAIYPDYIDVTVPVDIAPLNFAMSSDSIDWICVEVKGSNTSGTSCWLITKVDN